MTSPDLSLKETLANYLQTQSGNASELPVLGKVTKILGNVIRATVENAHIGEECILLDPVTKKEIRAEIVGMDGDEVLLAPGDLVDGLSTSAQVLRSSKKAMSPCGEELLGRIVDAYGKPLDGGVHITTCTELKRLPPDAMKRTMISKQFETRIRAIDGVLTLGIGQRIGLFGSAGVGKSVLLSQIVRGAVADVIVVGLIGERGREVAEFISHNLGEEGLSKSCIFVSTADRPAGERLRAAYAATAAAEYFRDQGLSVLLVIDSATRVARATREIGLAAGESPVRRGFPPSTFTTLPGLLERAGTNETGAITAIYTILVEGDNDDTDPVADELRSLLDGHIILSRKLAEKGHFPAIDISRSKSRIMDAIVSKDQSDAARKLVSHITKLDEIELLLQVGEYQPGGDPDADTALAAKNKINAYLQQRSNEFTDFEDCKTKLLEAVS